MHAAPVDALSEGSRELLAFPFHDWRKSQAEGFRTRDAHLLQAFARRADVHRVLVVNRPTSVSERVIRRVSRRIEGDLRATRADGRTEATLTAAGPKVDVLDVALSDVIGPLSRRRGWWFDAFVDPSVARAIDWAVTESLGRSTDVVAWVPTVAPVAFRYGGRVVFDSLDNWLIHPSLRVHAAEARRAYAVILSQADRVAVSGPASAIVLSEWRADIDVIPNGVDPARFRAQVSRPADLPARPIVGYAGKLAARIDDQLVAAVADSLPNVTFVFIGPVLDRGAVREMRRRVNVKLLGDRQYEEMPAYLAAFDIAWIPHRVGEGETGGDPIKLYEYWAAGRQVISTRIDGSAAWASRAHLVTTPSEAVEAIGGLLDGSLARLPTDVPPGRTWDAIAEALLG